MTSLCKARLNKADYLFCCVCVFMSTSPCGLVCGGMSYYTGNNHTPNHTPFSEGCYSLVWQPALPISIVSHPGMCSMSHCLVIPYLCWYLFILTNYHSSYSEHEKPLGNLVAIYYWNDFGSECLDWIRGMGLIITTEREKKMGVGGGGFRVKESCVLLRFIMAYRDVMHFQAEIVIHEKDMQKRRWGDLRNNKWFETHLLISVSPVNSALTF